MKKLIKEKNFCETERFILRRLGVSDASERYLSWFEDESAQKYIVASKDMKKLESLKDYIKERENRDDVIFLGIFDKTNGEHIGNVKYEPVSKVENYAIMGILIGEKSWRGKNVAQEVIIASSQKIYNDLGISQIFLGVDLENTPAVNAYLKMGFQWTIFKGSDHFMLLNLA